MPNWCFQNLTVYGRSKEDVKPFLDAIKNKNNEDDDEYKQYSLNQLVPRPKCLENSVSGWFGDGEEAKAHAEQSAKNLAECGWANWYDWANDNWGTKWGACDVDFCDEFPVHDGYLANLRFTSAWSPAIPLITKISSQFPNLMFSVSFTEESDAFAGVDVFVNGVSQASFEVEPDISNLPPYSEENAEEYYDALLYKRNEMFILLDDNETAFMKSAKEAIPQ